MSEPAFTILLPVHRGPVLMQLAIASVQAQSRGDFELFIVCDGAPDETVAAGMMVAARDSRCRVFPFPKGERHGEHLRDLALREARGRYVAHIADDDLWLCDHLDELGCLLSEVDFGGVMHSYIEPDGTIHVNADDLANPVVRRWMCDKRHNVLGITVAGYRLDAYRSLPVGWSPAPADIWTDLFMWRKFLVQPDIRAATRFVVTSVQLPAVFRSDWSIEQRRAEMAGVADSISTSVGRGAYREKVFRALAHAALEWRTALFAAQAAQQA